VLWAGLAFLFSYIPSIGYIMIVIPPTIATLVRFGFGRALVVLVGLTLIDNAVGIILLPRLIGRRLDVAPFWGMLSLVVWGWLLGPAGAILAIPLTMFAKFLLDSSPSTEPLGRLVAPLDRPGPRKDRGRRIVGQA
jgi:predicted PurR-regulated permease PerM